RRCDEHVAAGLDVGPAAELRRGGPLGEATAEPLGDGRMEAVEHRVHWRACWQQRQWQGGHPPIVADGYDTHSGGVLDRESGASKRRRLGANQEERRWPGSPFPRATA